MGGNRFCANFIKSRTISNHWFPFIDDVLTLLGKAKYFSMIDLRSDYWLVTLNETEQEKATFACHMRLFEFRVMPSDLANVPGIFQQLMSIVLSEM